jgi:hypothetical protein
MSDTLIYRSTVDGATERHATRGSAFHRRMNRSGRWRLVGHVGADGRVEYDEIGQDDPEPEIAPGEPGTFDAPRCPACPHEAHSPRPCEPCEDAGEPCEVRSDDAD